MTWADWDKDIDGKTVEELARYKAALETLKGWEAFEREFKWTSIFLLITFISDGLRRRERKEVAR